MCSSCSTLFRGEPSDVCAPPILGLRPLGDTSMYGKGTGEDAVVVALLAADSELRVSVAVVDYNDGILC